MIGSGADFPIDPKLVTRAGTKDKNMLSSVPPRENCQHAEPVLVLPPSAVPETPLSVCMRREERGEELS